MSRRMVAAAVSTAAAACALYSGAHWANGVYANNPDRDDARPMTWVGHEPIYGSNGDRVGWIVEPGNDGLIRISLPSSDDPLSPVAVAVNVVYGDNGRPIGIFGPRGFQPGALHDGQLDPAVRQQIIDDALANTTYTTLPPTSS